MASSPQTILVCSCEDTMRVDAGALGKACRGATVEAGRHLCRSQIDRFRAAAAKEGTLTVACTQETAIFEEVAAESGRQAAITYVNIREHAGWSADGAKATPKMAALVAAAQVPMPAVPMVSFESEGTILVYGRDESAIEAATLLQAHMDVTVLLKTPTKALPPTQTEFPIVCGTIKGAKGYLGAFELTVDAFAQPAVSSRASLVFGPSRDNAKSTCDVILDISGGAPLFSASDLRNGYVRADPGDPVAVLKAVLRARDLTGTFEKPRYVTFDKDLCAHSRSRISGCTRCLELCPTGAIAPAGNHVAIDPHICAGCGQCAAVCPTGAASYALPPVSDFLRKLRTLLTVYRQAGGEDPIVLMHDEAHGGGVISALARHGEGLPANVLPLAVNEVTQVGLEALAAAFAYGASSVRLLLRARPAHDVVGLDRTIELADRVLVGLGFGPDRVHRIDTDDPDALGSALRGVARHPALAKPSEFDPIGDKRSVLRFALRELHGCAPAPVDVVALPERAPFGTVNVDVAGCTLCLSCVAACPTGALSDDPERPVLRFSENACVQCGLCKATCPEKVITLQPQIDFRAATAPARVIKEEQPFCCLRCGKPFGVRSTIERVAAKLEGKHWMYKGTPSRLDVIKMCDDCRVAVVTEQDFDPYGAKPRPPVRTTEDYLRQREAQEKQSGEG